MFNWPRDVLDKNLVPHTGLLMNEKLFFVAPSLPLFQFLHPRENDDLTGCKMTCVLLSNFMGFSLFEFSPV